MERFGVRDLGDTTLEQLRAAENVMSPTAYKRCRHIVSDNARVREAREAMYAGDPVALGALMLSGHASERDDFEVSIDEVDFLVESAAGLPGCYGARLTGGGFGGCTVNLVRREMSTAFAEALQTAYQAQFNITAETYVCDPVAGAWVRNAMTSKVRA
jgi:galactokinase